MRISDWSSDVCSFDLEAVERIGVQKEFGEAGAQLVIEERLHGQEASVLALTDGMTIVMMPACQDHKAAFDGDKGPNTGRSEERRVGKEGVSTCRSRWSA